MSIPAGFKGALLQSKDQKLRRSLYQEGEGVQEDTKSTAQDCPVDDPLHDMHKSLDGNDDDDFAELDAVELMATFKEVVVWGHDSDPPPDDPHMRAVDEWVLLAATVRTTCCMKVKL